MNRGMIKAICCTLTVCMLFSGNFFETVFAQSTEKHPVYDVPRYEDVPAGHPADNAIHLLRLKGAVSGEQENKFGMGQTLSGEAFIYALERVMGWQPEQAAISGLVAPGQNALKNLLTRKEAARLAIKALGQDELALALDYLPNRFADVSAYGAYINMAADYGLFDSVLSGSDGMLFLPDAAVTREEAAMILAKLYERINTPVKELHGFYAIKAFNQIGMIQDLTSVSFGWSRLTYDSAAGQFCIEMTSRNGNEFALPKGFTQPMALAREKSVSTQLNLFASNEAKVLDPSTNLQVGMVEFLLASPERQDVLIRQAVGVIQQTQLENEAASFDGIVIDFESLRGEGPRGQFSQFLKRLKQELDKNGKKLYVAVHPGRGRGQAYYDGYDYKAIGEVADRVILMAHDYNATRLNEVEMAAGYVDTPLTPIDEIYYALRLITDKTKGVADPGKIWLQISFDAVQWKRSTGTVVNQTAYRPSFTQIAERLRNTDPNIVLEMKYSKKLESPYIKYLNNGDGTESIIWYEDSRSVEAKVELAKYFGIGGISLWRLGNIPDFSGESDGAMHLDVWQKLKASRQQ